MRKNEKKITDINDLKNFAQALKKLTPRQMEVIKNLTNALYDVQVEICKVRICEEEQA